MKVAVGTLRNLLEALSQKTGLKLDHSGLNAIEEKIPGLAGNYLYKKISQEVKKKTADDVLGVGEFQINQILTYLGVSSLPEFQHQMENPIDEQLASLTGNYYSYVRANHREGRILRSPVRIFLKNARLMYELRGKDNAFHGEIAIRDGIVFVLMQSPKGKCFHHVYKIGSRHQPKVMQGVFSGVSSAPDPIAGRALLIRQELAFEKLTNEKQNAEALISSADLEETRVGTYFKEYHNNNVSPSKSSDFGYDDLIQ